MGEIPEAPGLEDLDQLYPEDVDNMRAKRDDEEVVEVTSAMPLPALPLPTPEPAPAPPKKKGRKLKFLMILILLGAIGGAAYYFLA